MAEPEDKLLDHNYDGINEYDNPLPRWWLFLFVITIIWGFLYLYYYHVSGFGESSSQEYTNELKKSESQNNVPESKLEKSDFAILTDAQNIDAGKLIFQNNCIACHGKLGEGGVGPNLTDDYWIHGGRFEDIVTTIFNGVPEKGMIAWRNSLSKQEIIKVASFVKTLHGLNPPNAKAPQGQLFKEE